MDQHRGEVALAFAAFVVIGLGGGAQGVLLPAQIAYYGVNKSTIGLVFFTFSAGYLFAGAVSGWVMRRLGLRGQLMLGAGAFATTAFGAGLLPPYVVLLALLVVYGFGGGIMEAALNAFLAGLPRPVVLLNLLHACYGIGALVGPVLTAMMFRAGLSWGAAYLVFAVAGVALLAGFALRYPNTLPGNESVPAGPAERSAFGAALRHPAVLLSGVFLAVYVGVEIGLGNWLYSLLTEDRGQDPLLAGWFVSAFWMGFTLGRLVLSVLAERFGVGPAALAWGCLAGVTAAAVAVWLLPGGVASGTGLVVLGFALGPLYPLTIAVLPLMTPARLVPTAIGMLVGVSVLGGAVFPWLAGTLAQLTGIGSLMPFTLLLCAVLLAAWWRLARRLAPVA